jgi:hypothetical protein
LIADQPGRFTIPALSVPWWDTRAKQRREASLAARTLVVTPAPGSTVPVRAAMAAQTAQARPGQVPAAAAVARPAAAAPAGIAAANEAARASPGQHLFGVTAAVWLWVSAALAFAWLATLGAWLRLRRRAARSDAPPRAAAVTARVPVQARTPANVSARRAAFRLACQRDDAPGARRHLLAWVSAASPEWAPTGLNALARQIDDPELAALVRELDRACFAGESWRGEALGAALREPPRPKRDSGSASSGLAPLYP